MIRGELKLNKIYCGDNLEILRNMPSNSVDLIYLDPPFFSNRNYEVIWNDGSEIRAFEDRWKGGVHNYITWMKKRVVEMHRVLKDTGSFYLHCDYHASHYLKVMLDSIFGYDNFRNEIVWKYPQGIKHSQKKFLSNHDVILFYTKSDVYVFNPQEEPYNEKQLKRFKHEDEHGKYYWDTRRDKNGKKRRVKVYLKKSGTPVGSVWYYNRAQGNERLGYPTQKPEKLLERIILASSNPGDVVLDPFCGCGTTITVASKLGRNWIGIDVSPTACKLMAKRLRDNGVDYKDSDIIGLPMTEKELYKLNPFEFQNWACGMLGARVSSKKSGDKGIDGFIPLTNTVIQVKRSYGVGRNVVDNFETAIRRAKADGGIIVGFGFSKDAYEEAARVKNEEGIDIRLVTVKELIENGDRV